MSSLQEIDTQLIEYENKIALLKKTKISKYNFFKYFNISDVDRKQLTDMVLEVKYNYNDHVLLMANEFDISQDKVINLS